MNDQWTDIPAGSARIFNGDHVQVGKHERGTFAFAIEFCPTIGREKQRYEIFIYGKDGKLVEAQASEVGKFERDGIKLSGRHVSSNTPFARTGKEVASAFIAATHTT